MQTTIQPKTAMMTHLLEYASGGRVDRANAVIRGVKILGRESPNGGGRVYSDQAMRDAARLYEGIGVNLDHPDRATPGANRSVKDRIGTLSNCRVSKNGVFGDLTLIKGHPYTPAILEIAESNPVGFGLSHNAQGPTSQRYGQNVVESITRVRSVDIVNDPATNRSLFESDYRDARIGKMTGQDMPVHDRNQNGIPDEDEPAMQISQATIKGLRAELEECRKIQASIDARLTQMEKGKAPSREAVAQDGNRMLEAQYDWAPVAKRAAMRAEASAPLTAKSMALRYRSTIGY